MSEQYRLDIVSGEDPDRPLRVEFVEAVDHEAACRAGGVILRNHGGDPGQVYGNLWVHVGCGRAEYVDQVDLPDGSESAGGVA